MKNCKLLNFSSIPLIFGFYFTGFSIRRSNDKVWYLFCRRNHNKRVKRTTKLGFWKLTGRNRHIKANVGIGIKKTLVFYEGRVPKGKWTPWVIHEYNLPDTLPNQVSSSMLTLNYVSIYLQLFQFFWVVGMFM